MVVTVRIEGYNVKRVLIDQGSQADVMYPDLYRGLGLRPEDLEACHSPLIGFDGKMVAPLGRIKLPVQIDGREVRVNFIAIGASSPYTAILGRPWLHSIRAVPSTLHLKVKYPIHGGVGELLGDQAMARRCLAAAVTQHSPSPTLGHSDAAKWQLQGAAPAQPAEASRQTSEELVKVLIGICEEQYFQIGSQLPPKEKSELVEFLKANLDVFAWDASDIPGISPELACHRLNVNPEATPRKQPPRRSSDAHTEAVKEEVNRLKQAGAIKEIFYPDWLANTVVVQKKSEKWRVCVDFTDLNRACPKDPFPIPKIDQLVDATVGHPRMSFLDAFQGYHQIPLSLAD